MKRDQFLNELRRALTGLQADELNSVVSYYSEMIDDRMEAGLGEEEAIAAMEPADVIAREVFADRPAEKPRTENEETEKTITYEAGGIHEIRVKTKESRIKVMPGESNKIILRYTDTPHEVYHASCECGVLSLEREPVRGFPSFFQHFGFHWETDGIDVTVPKEFAGNLILETANSSIAVHDIACWGIVHAQTSNSKITARDLSAKLIDFKTGNSKIELTGVRAQNELSAKTSNSRIIAENAEAGRQLSLITSNGHIVIKNVKSPDIILRSSNSGISGTIAGKKEDFAIDSGTSNARNNLPSSTAGGTNKLSVHTSNAGIQILFAE